MYFKLQKFASQNLVNQTAVFCVRNALKVTYEHVRSEKISRLLYPGPPLNREGGHREGKKRKGGEERESRDREEGEGRKGREGNGAPLFQSSAASLTFG
jgi:hypothetical protein